MALQYRLQPRVEATVRLRYASILYEETDNLDEAEDALNKAVRSPVQSLLLLKSLIEPHPDSTCWKSWSAPSPLLSANNLTSQNNLIDLKCSMQFLLVKIMYKNSHKAALKMLNTFLAGVEA